MGVKRVKASGRVKSKATPKKATPKKTPVKKATATPRVLKSVTKANNVATPKSTPRVAKPETKANNVATPKATPVRGSRRKPAAKKSTPKKKIVSNNTPVKKEVNNTAPSNDVPAEKKETRKRAAPKSVNNVPAKRVAKAKPAAAVTPAAKKPARAGRGRSAARANNVSSASLSTPSIKLVASSAKATNNTDKKQSKAKPAKRSLARAKKTAATKTPKTPQSNAGKVASTPRVTKARASVGKRSKRTPATKTKIVVLNPVVEIEPLLQRYADIKQVKMNPKVVLRRIDLCTEVSSIKLNPVVLLRRIDLYHEACKKRVSISVPRIRFARGFKKSLTSRKLDQKEDDSPQNNKQNVTACLTEIDSTVNQSGNSSTDETSSHGKLYESEWFIKKYKPSMEKIKNLTYDEIATFVRSNNKEYYEKIDDSKKPVKGNANADTKNLFKCNPFNSEQQLAMYLTLREVFNVPETHFKQCKWFFTVIMPEISCQLFAQIFSVKVNSAPRLIKKLYPNPVSPF